MRKLKGFFLSGLCLTISLLCATSGLSQEITTSERDYKVRPVRLGIKLGFPNVAGGNLEYVTPLLNDRLSATLDYSIIKSDWILAEEEPDNTDNTSMDFSYFEIGLNYYLFKSGKGLYTGIGYNNFSFEGETSVESNGRDGTGFVDYKHGSLHVKLGAKLGGLFYFRPEIGYSFSSLPETISYIADYEDGTSETETFDLVEELAVPDIFFKGLMANIGIGFAF
ncbi:hypothetical protein [Salinimicrobium oceani]|uniref:Outer membrane protein beta-barrel domain-containing protein n=1 Tax=Salinimicrobium oceani TaxID=2722702 RepID=A0ABX1CUF6_9FLAO|nr:hypothetical protein [Salinimicrobium oceani]NJW51397.1 hypothetical protein [Salinimicrobium oceani]